MVFEKKKIQGETLGEYLLGVRKQMALSVAEAAKKTAIREKFLQSLEQGNFSALPPDVYVFGFLRQLGQLYATDPEVLINQYKKEKAIQSQMQVRGGGKGLWAKKYFQKIVVTPKLLSLMAGLLFVAVSLVYIIWQVLSINRTPDLEIFQPKDNQVVQGNSITLEGKTNPGISVMVNGQSIFVDDSGGFQAQVGIQSGPTELDITAQNRFGKQVTKPLSVIGAAAPPDPSGQVVIKLQFSGDVNLTFAVDNAPSQTIVFHNGDTKTIIGQQQIVLSTSNAGATRLTLNGQSIGALGRPREVLDNMAFLAQPANISTTTPK